MFGAIATLSALFADAAPAAAPPNGSSMFIVIGGVFAIFYLMIMRPQQQQEKKRRAMIDALKKNDKVLTAAGIYGTVVSVDSEHDRIVIRVDDEKNVKFPFTRSSIVRVIDVSQEKEKASETP